MNNTLEQSVYNADGRYFTDEELTTLTEYCQTYPTRLKTYTILCEQAPLLVQQALQQLAQVDGATVLEHRDKCTRDMSYVLQSIAIAILKDDNEGFRQRLILWMQNIMAALHKEAQSARAYQLLKTVIRVNMPAENAELINDNLDEFIKALTAEL
jgi:hypothetical protein